MYTKLTLNITDTVVEKAKMAARKRKTSVSRIVEEYLKKIPEEKDSESVVDFFIKNAPAKKTKPGTEKTQIKAYLKKKYGY
jgi:Asp-tRNA(Asn)/Glu-tRNA(Gln) amidotransferase A subunit family amidase